MKLTLVLLLCAVCISGCSGDPDNYRPPAGYVPDAKTAIKIAEAVWVPIYGEKELRGERPFVAELRGDVWYVQGTLTPPSPDVMVAGGTAIAEIDKRTGKILRVIHDR